MQSVRPYYSKMIPNFASVGPQRLVTGFVRSPNVIPGARPPPGSPLGGTYIQQLPANYLFLKLSFDQSGSHNSQIPVSRVVKASLPRPRSAQPAFLFQSAGLPGGLSITEP